MEALSLIHTTIPEFPRWQEFQNLILCQGENILFFFFFFKASVNVNTGLLAKLSPLQPPTKKQVLVSIYYMIKSPVVWSNNWTDASSRLQCEETSL